MDFANPVFVAEGGFPRLREIGRILARAGIPSQVVAPPGACSTNG